jgi:SpoIID/LytB domain protein
MKIKIGLTGRDLLTLKHPSAKFSGSSTAVLEAELDPNLPNTRPHLSLEIPAGQSVQVKALGDKLVIGAGGKLFTCYAEAIRFHQIGGNQKFFLDSPASNTPRPYIGDLLIRLDGNGLRLIVDTDIDQYVYGVLQGEMPASFQLEALKAQAVAARTYGLRPRIDHAQDFCNVCDSYLCCQVFAGVQHVQSERHKEAIESTRSEILVYQDQPILALFSSCAGGRTEDYQYCFSDLGTNRFPGTALPYLKAVSESDTSSSSSLEAPTLKYLLTEKNPQTYDAWSSHFKWQVEISADALEAHMHHTIELLLADKEQAPFVMSPKSGVFGHIEGFEVEQRGQAGTIVCLAVKTSKGVWRIKKELVIRNAFANPEIKLKRLSSARFILSEKRSSNGLLDSIAVAGLGWGHGVGMQQTGAEGMAKHNIKYEAILAHYFAPAKLIKV